MVQASKSMILLSVISQSEIEPCAEQLKLDFVQIVRSK